MSRWPFALLLLGLNHVRHIGPSCATIPATAHMPPRESPKRPGHASYENKPEHNKGRWPPNVLMDEAAAALLDQMSGERKSGGGNKNIRNRDDRNAYGKGLGAGYGDGIGGDTGGASRFMVVLDDGEPEPDGPPAPRQLGFAALGDDAPLVEHHELVALTEAIRRFDRWDEVSMKGAMATVAHAAYHLGAESLLVEREARVAFDERAHEHIRLVLEVHD